MKTKPASRDIHQEVTEQIVSMLNAGTASCQLPWHRGGPCSIRPTNAITERPYQGINILSLWARSLKNDYSTGVWATFRQWQSIGAQVRKGEKGTSIVFYKPVTKKSSNGDPDDRYLLAKSSRVFSAEQVDGYRQAATQECQVTSAEALDQFIAATGAKIEHNGDTACYRRSSDVVLMPTKDRFRATHDSDATTGYYAVLLHELTHWTGHESRCDRRQIRSYPFEELVAELGAAFLCADLGISVAVRESHADYLASWLTELENDKKAIFRASSLASKAVEYLHNLQPGAS